MFELMHLGLHSSPESPVIIGNDHPVIREAFLLKVDRFPLLSGVELAGGYLRTQPLV